ncbi:MAG: DNA internalization-related competence protein ComEC/Rec2 [bacterium]
MKRPLLAPLIGLMGGIALARFPTFSPWVAGVCGLAAAVFLFLSAYFRKIAGVYLFSALLFVSVGAFSAFYSLEKVKRESNLDQNIGAEKIYWIGKVDGPCEQEEEGGKLTLEMLAMKKGEAVSPLSGRLSLRIGKSACRFQPGEVVQSFSRLRLPDRYRNFHSFDYPFFLLTRGITAVSYVDSDEFVVKVGDEPPFWGRKFSLAKQRVREVLEKIPSVENRKILSALLLGEKNGLSSETEELFRKTGTTHLLVVSGLHLAMVGSVFYFLFRFLFSLYPPLLLKIRVRVWALFFSLPAVFFYALLVGFSPSVLRAVFTAGGIALLLLLSREREAVSLLFLVAFLLLLFRPFYLFDLSFQLSFLSVFSILLFVPRWEKFWREKKEGLLARPAVRRIFEVLAASLAVQVGLFPVLVHQFHRVSLVSLPANLLLVPVYTLLLMPLGMLGIFLAWMGAGLALPVFSLCAAILEPLNAFLRFLAALPGSYPFWTGFNAPQISLYYALLAACLLPLRRSLKRTVVVVLLLLNLGAWIVPSWSRRLNSDLALSFFDVGQGDAMLLELPRGKRVLIDGGGFANSNFDVGEKILLPELFSRGIWKIDAVMLTHPHPDHYGGLTSVIRAFHPKEFWWNGETADSDSFRELEAELDRQKISRIKMDSSWKSSDWQGVHFEFLWPPSRLFAPDHPDASTVNNHSLVMKIEDRGLSILFSGDVEKETEKRLLESGVLGPVTVLKVPHHGSDTSSTEEWVKTLCPKVALIGVGRENRFRFPKEEVLNRYREVDSQIFRTDEDGETRLHWDGKVFKVSSFGGRKWEWRPGSPSLAGANPAGVCRENPSGP